MPQPLTNRLIEALPPAEKAHLLGLLQPVALPLKTILFEVGAAPRYAHFLTSGLSSIVTALSGGDAIEVSLCGRDGNAEALHLLGPQTGETRGLIQSEGTGLRMEFQRFQEEFRRSEALHNLVLRYVQYESLITAQLVACNRLHEVEERMARWLLMVVDRTGSPHVQLTQEFLAQMIGARRSTVTLAAGALQRAGTIEYQRGSISVTDRARLEGVACECYPVTKKLFDTLYA